LRNYEKERPDARAYHPWWPQKTALNCDVDLEASRRACQNNVEMHSARPLTRSIKRKTANRFDKRYEGDCLDCPRAGIAHNMEEAVKVTSGFRFP